MQSKQHVTQARLHQLVAHVNGKYGHPVTLGPKTPAIRAIRRNISTIDKLTAAIPRYQSNPKPSQKAA